MNRQSQASFRALVAIGLVAGSTVLRAHAAPVVTVHRVSDQSPFAAGACGSDITRQSAGLLGPADPHGYEQEPAFAITPQGLVAAWIQDGALGIVAAHSGDGGATWAQNVPPAMSNCQPGSARLRVVDPRLVVDGNGTTLLSSIAAQGLGSLTVSTSPDGGATWSQPAALIPGTEAVPLPNDFPTMSADPTNPHAVSIVWSLRIADSTWFARTTDDGATWSTPVPIRVTPAGLWAFNSLVTLPDGTLVDVTADYPFTNYQLGLPNVTGTPWTIGALRSTDHGATWSEMSITTVSGEPFPSDPVVGPDGSVTELVSSVEGGLRTWKLFRSTDGAVWSQVATVPLPDDSIASIAITSDGTIGVLYDDHRNDVSTDQELTTDVWLTYSHDGGVNWNDLHLGGPFDLKVANDSVGDYQELHAIGNGFGAVFVLGAPTAVEGPTDIFFARVSF